MFTYELTPVAEVVISEEPKLKPVDTQTKADEIKGTYSLEEDKQKSEMDRKIREANLLKDKKRKQIKKLIQDFEKLRLRNQKLPEACRLTKEWCCGTTTSFGSRSLNSAFSSTVLKLKFESQTSVL